MKEENEITQEVKELLDSLERHGRNARRQKELSDLINSLAREEKPIETNYKRRKLYPLWWIVGAAAACLLFWLWAKPAMKETPNMNEEILVEEESVILEEPIIPEKLFAKETSIQPAKPQTKTHKPTSKAVEEISDEPVLAENTAIESTKTEPTDTSNIESAPIPIIAEKQHPTPHSSLPTPNSQRRVIRSLNLVCYECQKEPENTSHSSLLTPNSEKTLFGQPQDPNMKNGSLAFEVKLY